MNTNTPTSSTCTATDSSQKRIEQAFTRFAAFYGHVWRSQFKSDGFLTFAKKEWQQGLEPFSDEILDKAILDCRDHYEMPPTLPQLIKLCRDIKKRTSFYAAEVKHQPANKAVVEENIRQCKAKLLK